MILIFREVNKLKESNPYNGGKEQQWEIDPIAYSIKSMREWRDLLVWTQRPDLMSDVGEIDLTFGNVVSQTASSSSSPAFSPLVPPKMVFDAGDYLPSLVFGKTFSFFISTL